MTNITINIIGPEIYAGRSSVSNREGEAIENAISNKLSGKKYLNRATRLAILASDRILKSIVQDKSNGDEVGLCVATFGAHFEQSTNQFREIENSERPMISPMLGPNNTPNAIAGQLSIYHKTMAFALSFCDSGTAGLEALVFGINAILQGRAKRVLVIGVESRSPDIEHKIFGEVDQSFIDDAIAFLITEDQSPAKQGIGQAVRYFSHGRSFSDPQDPLLFYKAISNCLKQALRRGGIGKNKIDAVFLGSSESMLNVELKAIADNIGLNKGIFCITPDRRIKAKKCISALIKLRYAMELMNSGYLPKTAVYLGSEGRPDKFKNIIINDFNQDGSMGCLIVSHMR